VYRKAFRIEEDCKPLAWKSTPKMRVPCEIERVLSEIVVRLSGRLISLIVRYHDCLFHVNFGMSKKVKFISNC
jgi:hypothetical protein